MKLKHVFIFNAVVALVYGIGAIFFTTDILSLHDMSTDATGILLGRFFGASLVGIGLVTLLVRDVTDKTISHSIALGLLISDVAGFVVALLAMLDDLMSALGWLAVGIYAVLALGYGYFRFVDRSSENMPV